jgi:hypothetical protein
MGTMQLLFMDLRGILRTLEIVVVGEGLLPFRTSPQLAGTR